MIEAVEAIVSGQSGLTNPLEASLLQSVKEELSEEAEEHCICTRTSAYWVCVHGYGHPSSVLMNE